MAEKKRPWRTRFGIDVKGESFLRSLLQVSGSVSFTTEGKLFMPESDRTAGELNEVRINPNTNEMEIYRNGGWLSVTRTVVRWDADTTTFIGNAGNTDVTIPHVENNVLANVPAYRATSRGSQSSPAYNFSNATNSGMWISADNNTLILTSQGLDFLKASTSDTNLFAGGSETVAMTSSLITLKKAVTANLAVTHEKSASFKDGFTVPAGATTPTLNTGLTIATGNLEITAGQITAGGNVVAFSDRRVKTDEKPIENIEDPFMKVKVYHYFNEATGSYDVGFMADEMQELFPRLVENLGDVKVNKKELKDFHGVRYASGVPYLWAMLQSAMKRIEALEAKE
ncbi:hypothetical protein [Vibrio phage YC]|uniref:Peptidase S74 domain-containing protein n=1 Tax=Vibrio phage YC TaxID=2267403 RepID=A0A384ZS93_9CAUD|nr:hypothetical protein HWB64_gp163 [Vibrio phage YC]AXC34532.1 hypothetical protein [Vibrio phage YC]